MKEKTFEELRNESVKILGHETFIDYFNDLQGNADFYIEERINKICDHVMQQVREATGNEFIKALEGVNLPTVATMKIMAIITHTNSIKTDL